MNTNAMTARTITAFFDDREDATEAIQRLQSEGIPRGDVGMVEGGVGMVEGGNAVGSSAPSQESTGFWDSLKDFFLPDEDRHTYAEGLRRGGYLVTVRTDDAHYERVLDILDDEGTIDMDERAASWRKQGWTPQTTESAAGASTTTWAGVGAGTQAASRSSVPAGAPSLSPPDSHEEVIPVAEEELRIGKRDVSHGRVRVRSYVVETPVQEQVGLREEHVRVERRPADRPVSGEENLFRERTIEADEKAEDAMIGKQARVKEQLVVKKDVGQRTETVSDKVRRTEVEVDDGRSQPGRPNERKRP